MTKQKFYLHPIVYEILPLVYAILGIFAIFASGFFAKLIGISLLSAAYVFICMRNHYRVEHGIESWLTRAIIKRKKL
jgi:hypothetical protein